MSAEPSAPSSRARSRWARAALVVVGLAVWFLTQSLLGARQGPAGDAAAAGRMLVDGDGVLDLLAPLTEWLEASPGAANALLISSSLVIDALGVTLLLSAVLGPSVRPFLALLILFGLRQVMQALCALPAPAGMIWHDPGFPSLLVTYSVANDFFFSGHTALAVLGALHLRAKGGALWRSLALGVVAFEVTAVLALRAHYTMDVFTGAVVALLAMAWAERMAPIVDRRLEGAS